MVFGALLAHKSLEPYRNSRSLHVGISDVTTIPTKMGITFILNFIKIRHLLRNLLHEKERYRHTKKIATLVCISKSGLKSRSPS